MLVTRTSLLTGVVRTLEVDVTQEQLDAIDNGLLVIAACPQLRDNHEMMDFLVTGDLDEDWNGVFSSWDADTYPDDFIVYGAEDED